MENKESKGSNGNPKILNKDIAIIGGGAAGMAASLAALEAGANVLMIEKTRHIGGVSKFFVGGGFAVESHIQKEVGYNIKKEEVLQTLIEYSNFLAYGPLVKAIIYKSADTIKWLEKYGVKFYANLESPQLAHRDDPIKWQNYHWYEQFGKKTAALDILYEKLQEMGLKTQFNTTITEIIKDNSGKIAGIKGRTKEGREIIINAKSVIIATGGFSNNKEMMEETFHTPYIEGMGNRNHGEGLKLAWSAGAARWDMQSALLHGIGILPPKKPGTVVLRTSPLNQIFRSPLMWIDQSGNRFCNEEAVYDTAFAANVGYSVGGRFYILVDSHTLKSYTEGKTLTMDPAVGGPNMEPADFIELAEEGVIQENIVKGETLEELAANLNMDKDRLIANVEEYNKAVETKEDKYGKSPKNLVYGIKEGPFYAIKMMIGNLGTTGGVRVNEKLQATDVDLKPIEGLYVVGNDAGGFYGNTTGYPPYEGLATGFALNSGRIGRESAAEYILS